MICEYTANVIQNCDFGACFNFSKIKIKANLTFKILIEYEFE